MKKRGLFLALFIILIGLVIYLSHNDWKEEDGIIYFTVTSDGATGEQWVGRLKKDGYFLDRKTDSILCSPSFCHTNNATYVVAVFKGYLFTDSRRTDQRIREDAKGRMDWLSTPSIELACLIREKFSDREIRQMGLEGGIFVMNQPIIEASGEESLFILGEYYDGKSDCLYAGSHEHSQEYADWCGFAFVYVK